MITAAEQTREDSQIHIERVSRDRMNQLEWVDRQLSKEHSLYLLNHSSCLKYNELNHIPNVDEDSVEHYIIDKEHHHMKSTNEESVTVGTDPRGIIREVGYSSVYRRSDRESS